MSDGARRCLLSRSTDYIHVIVRLSDLRSDRHPCRNYSA